MTLRAAQSRTRITGYARGVGLALLLHCAGEVQAGARYDGVREIVLSGTGNTLASIAADIGKPQVFAYDAQTRTADCRAGLAFLGTGGELTIGRKNMTECVSACAREPTR